MYSFSPAFVTPMSSPIRDLFKYLSEPGMISFAGGYPDPEMFDVEGLREASVKAFQNSRTCLQYGGTDGSPELKAQIIRIMRSRGASAQPENVIVTTGSQQAFDLLMRVLVSAGDRVLVEQPTYTTNIQALHTYQARMTPVPIDADGLDIAALERLLANAEADADLPKLLYTVPTFGNPSGATLSLARRLRLLELAVQYRFVIVEDDPYSELRFSGEPVSSLLALAKQVPGASDWIVYLASLSKIVAPGIRVGWAIAPTEIARRIYVAKQSADVGSSPWTQGIAAEYLASGKLEAHLEKIRQGYGEKCRALSQGLKDLVGDAITFHEPQGGMFIWAKLTGGYKAAGLLHEAIPRKVIFVPGTGFHAVDPDYSTLRLSFSAPTQDEIFEGVRRLGEALVAVHATARSH
ncbi:aminotransferase-like domain-containing protein [Pseudomonas oryzae]|uniref:DNA-binding transcriptional regulator, MocR family, contains an aminotransferase domain n=1 Tax=Pseudomonas oryzae TaxID=1392877 RepID=A0A1H1TNT3_9PSED|nr:PLP-dependent aminotransferase family protein [Pseudomonas oryzae]SDS61229.1 DNA-binding transcriptional regulator, MocR family, contains an aminotransferase domain [Pseudomonas oryzae]